MSYLHYGIFLNDNPISITDQIGEIPNINEIDIIIKRLNELKSKGQDYIDKYNENVCEDLYKRIGRPPCEKDKKKEIIKIGYIYVIEDTKNNSCKIGVSKNNVKNRLSSMQTSNPNKLKILYKKKIKHYIKLEEMMHMEFKEKRLSGEWFKLNNDDIEYVKNKANQIEVNYGKV